MSLIQRLTSVEDLTAVERTGDDESLGASSPLQQQHHQQQQHYSPRLTFNPVPNAWRAPVDEGEEEARLVGAFEVASGKRIFQILTSIVYSLLSSGIVFGYAALKPILVATRVYRDRCTPDELHRHVHICDGQDLRLNLMFVCAAVGINVAALPVGFLLDRAGPRACALLGAVLLGLGALLFSFAPRALEVGGWDVYVPAYLSLALGGSCIFISSMHLSSAFPPRSGLILALLTGAFDSSSALFLGYRMVFEASNSWLTPSRFFSVYLVVPLFIATAQLFWMPVRTYKSVGDLVSQVEVTEAGGRVDEHTALLPEMRAQRDLVVTEINDLLGSPKAQKQRQAERRKHAVSGVHGAMHGRSLAAQIRSPWFVLITLFTMLQMMRINWFMATIRRQYTFLLGSHAQAVQINDFFDVALPLGGVLGIPLIGYVLDHTSTFFVTGVLALFAALIGLLGLLPYAWAAYANVALFVLYRPLYYTSVSDYTAKVFGFEAFGTVYGLTNCLAGLFNFAQSGLDAVTFRRHHGDPGPVNLGLLVAGLVVGVALCAYVGRQAHVKERDDLVREAERAEEVVMPGAVERDRL